MKVLSIVSAARSGSTLLDMLVGSADGCFSAGELRYLWERGVIERRHCGCGREVTECEVWSRVLASPRLVDRDPFEVVGKQQELARTRHTRRLLRSIGADGHSPQLAELITIMTALYEETGRVTGARVIVDSSKRPADAALSALLPGIQPYVVHLVRDPRGVAFSRRRHKAELDHESRAEMERRNVARTAANWVLCNAMASTIPRDAPSIPFMRLRYEDVVADPEAALARVLEFVGEPAPAPPVHDGVATLLPNHTVSGNPGRFATGRVPIRLDEAWRREMRVVPWAATTAIALPALHRYGYAARSGAPWRRDAADPEPVQVS